MSEAELVAKENNQQGAGIEQGHRTNQTAEERGSCFTFAKPTFDPTPSCQELGVDNTNDAHRETKVLLCGACRGYALGRGRTRAAEASDACTHPPEVITTIRRR